MNTVKVARNFAIALLDAFMVFGAVVWCQVFHGMSERLPFAEHR